MKLKDLKPGQMTKLIPSGEAYVFIGMVKPHPIFPSLVMAIWWKSGLHNGYLLDALDLEMELDHMIEVPEQKPGEYETLLRMAIVSAQQR